jgi:hypothetical protein
MTTWKIGPVGLIVLLTAGCHEMYPDAGHGDIADALFGRRHSEHFLLDPKCDPVMGLAREVTELEDDLRRDGTITVKAPDVWGDANLVTHIQEFDRLLAASVNTFSETLSAYIARSDQMELHSATTLAQGLGGAPPPSSPAQATQVDISTAPLFGLIGEAAAKAPPKQKGGIGVEPTELERQRATFIAVNQALRRRNMGDDNSRAAGYGLYLFRVPVSVLPGRETYEGHSAVVTMRAQLSVDEAHLRHTFPRLVVADLAEELAPLIAQRWEQLSSEYEHNERKQQLKGKLDELLRILESTNLPKHKEIARQAGALREQLCQAREDFDTLGDPISTVACLARNVQELLERVPSPVDDVKIATQKQAAGLVKEYALAQRDMAPDEFEPKLVRQFPTVAVDADTVYGEDEIRELAKEARKFLEDRTGRKEEKPSLLEVRAFVFRYLSQVHGVLDRMEAYATHASIIAGAGMALERGHLSELCDFRQAWRDSIHSTGMAEEYAKASWLLAVQSAILDRNLKKILEEMELKGTLPPDLAAWREEVQFFNPKSAETRDVLLGFWETIIREEFPLHVFALDPQIEEQNVYDAFARRREMQLALAYSVATGQFNMGQKLAMSRALALDMASIGLNRTAVAFSHGDDTFGWYFYPRVQSPPTESTNIGALARMIWSTGPTEHYDLKHRKLEPGMRECEVLVAMPSFVNEVAFDVTTNWESLAKPGKTKRSYEEMLAQGGRLHRLRMCLGDPITADCYRPGDYARLLSRVDQLEHMLGMQTHMVHVPYEYEQTGTDLFDTGDVQLRPALHGYYGLQYVQDGGGEAFVFLTGKNFHPALTHVIVGGTESHYLNPLQPAGEGGKPSAGPPSEPDVEVISREVLRVKIKELNAKLSADGKFEVRVATPAGVSNPLTIPAKEQECHAAPGSAPPSAPAKGDDTRSPDRSGELPPPASEESDGAATPASALNLIAPGGR